MNIPDPDYSLHRILIVDDEEIVLVALRETLRREGYDVVTAQNAIPALEMLKKERFSVILTDQQMPAITGLEFLAQVKQIQPDATRILITAVLSLSTVIDAINKGEIYRFVVKPWLREELLATVKNAVQRYELICKNSVLQATTLAMNEKLSKLNQSLAEQISRVADQNQQLEHLNQALEQNLRKSVELCLRTMQTFYPTLGSQARRVFELCKAMADGLGLPADQRQTLEISSWLHDIGLVGVPRQLIKRWEQAPESLDEAERAVVEQHPVLGQELAGFADHLEAVGPTIRAHHERFDGAGYPDKLAGENIPWLARLLAVAVSYAESNRTGHETVEVIKLGSGTAFDPEAVRVFLRCLPQAVVPRKQREVLLAELRPGMVLAKGIYTANGLLLIPDGQRLSEPYIDKLRNHNRINPISQSLLVYC
ncbi:MAG: response regulator [Chloroflexi bacterium]|nr:response regulator [Chloroflexota bacterium]